MIALERIAISGHTACCFLMTGVVWVIQLIHYPSFQQIDSTKFTEFHKAHTRALGFIAAPLMILEFVSSFAIQNWLGPWFIFNIASVVCLWIVTFGISVPAHDKLSKGFDKKVWRRLVQTNWIRTALWTVRSLFFLFWLMGSLRSDI